MERTEFLPYSKQYLQINYSILLLCVILPLQFINFSGFSQNNWPCGIHDSLHIQGYDMMYYGADNSSNTWLEKYRTPGHWIPTDNTPVKTILVNWIICQKDDGTGGWVDSPGFRAGVDSMFTYLNEWYSNSHPKEYTLTCEPIIDYITDTKVRFELNEIIFIRNTTLHRTLNGDLVIQYLEQHHPGYKKAMSHIFTMPDPQPSYWGYYAVNQTFDQSYVLTAHSMYWPFVVYHDHIHHIAHEYGHALGLHHTYDSEYRQISHYDFLDDIFGLCAEHSCTCNPPQGNVCYLTHNCFWQYQPGPYPLMAGMPNPRYISPKYAGRMHRALSLYKNIFKVNNLPMHKYVKERGSYINPLYITEDETWDFAIKLYQDIHVESGTTLTITNEVKMPVGGRIVVKPGAKLIIDGASITSAHDYPWQGIEVWGNSAQHQWPNSNGTYMQGYVELNNAVIENAVCALNLWKPGDYTKTGGIAYSTKTIFRNNEKSVHALVYRNFHPTNIKEMEYNSWFDNCTFEITKDYHGIHTFYKHVDLNQVNGMKFKGCDFNLSPEANNVSDYNQAIAAYSAGFKVEARCEGLTSPCNDWDRSTFNGFRVGVYAGNSGVNNNSYLINRALFTGNSIGVLSNNVDNAIVINSEFYSAKNQYNWEDCTYGIFVESGAGFTFEDNKFFKQAGAPLSNYIGIGAFNCETVSDIYKNEFTGLTAGNYAYGKNYPDFLYQGLEYICNINTGNWADFYVKGKEDDFFSGIQSKQGSTLMPARNQFSPTGATWHFYNETKNLIGYYYCQSCPGHYPAYVENVTREPVSVSSNCLSHYGSETPSTSIVLSTASKLTMETAFAFADMDFNSVKVLYNDLKDGGSTAGTISDISQALPSDMMELRARLLGDSPHLTTEVLKLVADRTDVFTEAAIFDILAANPDELKKEELMKYLEEKENPLPDYMISILKQVAEGTSYRTVLEMEMAKYSHDRSRAAGDMIRSILNDEELDVAQLRLWLTNLGGIEAERQIIASYAHAGDFTLALALAETLPQTYQLAGDDLTGHNQFVSVLQMQQNLVNSGRNIDQLTQSEQDQLRIIAEADNAVSAPMAKAILESFYGAEFSRCKPIDGTSSYKSQPATPNQLAVAYGLSITVKPNPAKEWAAFDYTLPEGVETASLEIVDANGKHVETIALKGNRGQQLIDTRTWIAGQYIYTLNVAGFTQSGKLVVVK
ncbi:hypothetical protein SDC9_22594 [bioreactor metagenome]|uniref:Secretion system C-terminal sorting domain-containing protein n=1 Tax=bioreactor metagenome TaxID=1076179 RepID=A0A644UCT7_9ZZZZ|nr:T9SS type A sorting domain-containing protein [Lentimicrobium sp.]MEA5112198.1 T9SS type A sorting domain-containing protein [Lentimicrobium sp.]